MPTNLILLDDVKGLGVQGDEVHVSDGYARNYLVPRGLAAPISRGTLKRLETLKHSREQERARDLDQAREMAAKLEGASCTISMKAGEGDRLYGSVGPSEIAEALAGDGIEVDRSRIHLDEPIKELGVFKAEIRLHPEVVTPVKVWVVKE